MKRPPGSTVDSDIGSLDGYELPTGLPPPEKLEAGAAMQKLLEDFVRLETPVHLAGVAHL